MARRLPLSPLVLALVLTECQLYGVPSGPAAAVFAGSALAAAAVNRAVTGDCYATCSKGWHCERNKGICQRDDEDEKFAKPAPQPLEQLAPTEDEPVLPDTEGGAAAAGRAGEAAPAGSAGEAALAGSAGEAAPDGSAGKAVPAGRAGEAAPAGSGATAAPAGNRSEHPADAEPPSPHEPAAECRPPFACALGRVGNDSPGKAR